jgi:hypothetical protein
LLIGRENLKSDEIKSGEIKNGKIKNGEIRDDKEDIRIVNCEKFFFNYINRCAVSIYSANLIINKIAIEIANTY